MKFKARLRKTVYDAMGKPYYAKTVVECEMRRGVAWVRNATSLPLDATEWDVVIETWELKELLKKSQQYHG